jgi:hypothetical protein
LTTKTPYKGPGADSEEKREPVSDIDTVVADSLKVLDLKRPIREERKFSTENSINMASLYLRGVFLRKEHKNLN